MAVGYVVVALVVHGAAWTDDSVNEASPEAGALVMVEADRPVQVANSPALVAMTAMCFCCCLTTWFLTKHGFLDFEATPFSWKFRKADGVSDDVNDLPPSDSSDDEARDVKVQTQTSSPYGRYYVRDVKMQTQTSYTDVRTPRPVAPRFVPHLNYNGEVEVGGCRLDWKHFSHGHRSQDLISDARPRDIVVEEVLPYRPLVLQSMCSGSSSSDDMVERTTFGRKHQFQMFG